MQFDHSEQVNALAALPPEPVKKPERGLWATAKDSLIGAAAKAQASAIEVGNVIGPALALAGDPGNDAALEAVKRPPGFGQTDVSKPFRDFERDLRPDPATAGMAEQIVYGATGPMVSLVGATLLGGPAGLAAASGEMGFSQAEDLRVQGVGLGTRSTVGVLTAGVTAASAALPLAGQTLKQTAALYLTGGPGAFMAQQQATRTILERADYGELAKQYDPLDPLGLLLSAAPGAPFAGYRAWQLSRATKQATPSPDQSPAAPTAPREAIDAAMVHNLTLQRDVRDAGAPTVDTARIQRAENLPPIERAMEEALARKVTADFDAAAAEYAARPDAMGGKVLNTDIARELSPDYLADRTRSVAVHEPASWFVKRLYERKLSTLEPGEIVMFSSGGTGAGKTTAINALGLVDDAALVYDTNMNTLPSSVQKIEQALEAGATVRIVHVQRDPIEALVKGALPRAMRQEREFGSGRTVPLVEHARTHRGAAEVLQQLAERYKDDPRVKIQVLDNTRGKGKVRVAELGFVRGVDYNGLEGKLYAALEQEHDAGRISGDVFRATQGAAQEQPRSVRGLVHPGDGRQPEPQRDGRAAGTNGQGAGGVAGSTATVVTERGLTVPVRYRLLEAGDLVTSHTDDLTPSAAFPVELQPRDRSRSASADQIARIENAVRPELLGESVKASDGAPIIGPDAVVESGNARTIALRRAYASNKADTYRAWLETNAERFGLTADQVRTMKRPVLVRERLGDVDRAEFARQANESTIAAMSPAEQAKADAARLRDLDGLSASDDGTINLRESAAFVRRFMQQAVAPTERGVMLQADGRLSQAGQQRLRNAIFAKAYGDSGLVSMLAESTDSNVRNILAGLMRAAPEVARLRDLIESGARQPIDVAPGIVRAVQEFSKLRDEGVSVDQFLAQGNLIEGALPPELNNLLIGLRENARSPRRVAEMLRHMVQAVDELGDPRQASLLDGGQPSQADMTANVVERLRTITDEQLTDTPPQTLKANTDPLMRSIAERVQAVELAAPDMPIGVDAQGRPITVADELARIRREAAEGTDGELGALDADLVRVAADCALAMGTA